MFLRQKEVVCSANAAQLVEGDRLDNPLGFDLHVPTNLPQGLYLLPRGLRDQNLATDGIRLDAGGQVDVAPYHTILGTLVRADVAYHHFARIYPNTHLYIVQ